MLRPVVIASCLLAFAGCPGVDGCDDTDAAGERTCDGEYSGEELQGAWVLRASGRRDGCEDRRLDGSFRLSTPEPIEVQVTGRSFGDGGDPLSLGDRDPRPEYRLQADPAAPTGLQVEGIATGSCLSVTLSEELDDGDALVYDLDGVIDAPGRASGELRGRGPESCEVSGEFTLELR